MLLVVLQRMVGMLRASALGQLLVLGIGAVALALPMLPGSDASVAARGRLVAVLVVASVLSALSARVAIRSERGYDTTPSDLPGDALALVPRLVAHGALVALPFALAWWVATAVAGSADVLGLVTVPLAALSTLLAPVGLLLACAAVAAGDPAWHPGAVARLVRGAPLRSFAAAWSLIGIAAAVAAPVALFAFVATANLGYAEFFAFGSATLAMVPVLGCGGLAAWRALGGAELVAQGAGAAGESSSAAAVGQGADAPAAGDPGWVTGSTWDVAIDGGAVWGTWLRLPAATRAALQVSWHAGPPPGLALASAAGAWWKPGDPAAPGEAVPVDLPAGDTYLQLESRAPAGGAQAVSVSVLVPAAQAA